MDLISLVVPVFNEEKTIPIFYKEFNKLKKKMKNVKFELIFVDDGSKDNTKDVIKNIAKNDKIVRYIIFSRNFGKDAAMFAGLEASKGDYTTTMDVDLQDPLDLLIPMYDAVKSGEYDSAAAYRISRKGESYIRSFFAHMFYKLMKKITKLDIKDGARDYRLINKNMKNAVLQLKEKTRFIKGIYEWVGFKTKWISYENINRVEGKTKWSFWKLFKNYIVGITANSNLILTLITFLGILFCLTFGLLLILFLLLSLVNSTNLIILFGCLFTGIILIALGIVGNYISKIYIETQNRPIYIVKETEKEMK